MPFLRAIALCLLFPALAPAGEMYFVVVPSQALGPISPYVYGLNAQKAEGLNATVRRMGGNRQTGYNWENNASNAGADWKHFNDQWPCVDLMGYKDCDQPGAQLVNFVKDNQAMGMDSLLTIPLVDYVSADRDGEVPETEKAPSRRFKKSYPRKKGEYTLTPDPKDAAVYQDECVNFLVAKFGKASEGGVKFYALDNEPAIWPSTHPRIHPEKTSYYEMINRTEAMAANITRLDPTALVFGAVTYGWQEMLTLQEAPEAKELNAQFETYLDFYLDSINRLGNMNKRRLVHVLDIHWYPEAQGAGKRITEGDTSPDSIEARVQAPRSLWDPTYVEKSWITQHSIPGKAIQLLPWVQEKINKRYPGTKLAVTEYDYGAGNHVSGGLAQADVLGIFGRSGVFMASYWGEMKPYNKAALKLYRDYDGKGSVFGDRAVSAAVEDVSKASVYAALDSKDPSKLWVVALNKGQKETLKGKFKLQDAADFTSWKAYGFGKDSAEMAPRGSGKLKAGEFSMNLPPLSATIIVCEK